MKKIVFHLDDSKNLRGGERQVLYLAKELKNLNYENIICCRKNFPLEKEAKKLQLQTLNLPYFFEWDIISAFILSKKIKENLNKNISCIIHSHTSHTAAIAYLTNLFIKTPRIVHRRVDFKNYNKLSTHLKYNTADKIITVSQAIKKILIENGIKEEKIISITSSIDFNQFKKINITDKKNLTIGSLIALVPHKDPLNLINAAYLCLKKNNNLQFIIGGNGPLMNECIKLIKKLAISDRFKMAGYIEDNVSFLNSLDIFVLPSKEEGLGSVLIEAMACGLPLIGTDAGGIPELIENNKNGLIVPKSSPEHLSNAILKLANDYNLRKQISENSYKKSKEFSSQEMAKKTAQVYEEIFKNFKSY